MPQYLSPGVYVEEMEAGSRPIEGVATSIAAFVGLAKTGPVNTPTLVSNWTQFSQTFGDFLEDSYLAHAVYGYFNNGGGSAYIVRIGASGDAAAPAIPAAKGELASGGDKPVPAYKVTAKEGGTAGNNLSVEVEDAPEGSSDDMFKLVVKRNNRVEEEFEVSTKRGAKNAVTVVNQTSTLVELGGAGQGRKPRPAGRRRPRSA